MLTNRNKELGKELQRGRQTGIQTGQVRQNATQAKPRKNKGRKTEKGQNQPGRESKALGEAVASKGLRGWAECRRCEDILARIGKYARFPRLQS